MTGARVFKGEQQFQLWASDVAFSHSGTGLDVGTHSYSLSQGALWIFNSVIQNVGFGHQIGASEDGDGASWYATLLLPDFGVAEFRGADVWRDGITSVVTLDCAVWCTDAPIWRLEIFSIDWTVNGSTSTFAPTTGVWTSTGLAPGYLSVLGIEATHELDLGVGATQDAYPNPYDVVSEITGNFGGGYRSRRDGDTAWYAAPIAIRTPQVPDCFEECTLCVSPSGMISGTTTWDVATAARRAGRGVGSWFQQSGGSSVYLYTRGEEEISGATGWTIIGNRDRSIVKRPLADYGQLWERGGYAEVLEMGERSCGPAEGPTSPYSKKVRLVQALYPDTQKYLGKVGSTTATVESPLAQTCWMPYRVVRSVSSTPWSNEVGVGSATPGTYPDEPVYPGGYMSDTVGFEVGWNVQRRNDNNDDGQVANSSLLPYTNFEGTASRLDPAKWTRLTNWAAPWWAYALKSFNWEVDGDSSDRWVLYWSKIGQQYFYQPSLGSGDVTLTRADFISSPGVHENGNGGDGGFMEVKAFGAREPWAGVWNFKLRPWDLPATVTLTSASEDRWQFLDADDDPVTVTFGATYIEIPVAATQIVYELTSWTVEPWMACAIWQKLKLDWDVTTLDHVKVYAQGIDDAEVLVIDDHRNVDRDWSDLGTLEGDKFAGTWGADYGVGAITDSPTDIGADGDSAAAMLDPTRVCVPQLLPGRTAARLRFELTPASGATVMKIKYPVFTLPTTTPVVKYLGRQFAVILWPNGPGIVLGGPQWWNYDLDVLRSTPVVQWPGNPTTVVDAYCTQRAFEGLDPTGSISTVLAGEYDDIEADPFVGSKAMNCAYQTMAWPDVLDGTINYLWHVTYSPPPMPMLVGPARDEHLQPIDGSGFAGVWDWATETRRLIVPGSIRSDVVSPDPEEIFTAVDPDSVAGWLITKHRHEVTNSEVDFTIRRAGTDVAEAVRPWHSWFWVYGKGEPIVAAGSGPWCTVSRWGKYHRAYSQDGAIIYARSGFDLPPFERITTVTDGSLGDSSPRMVYDRFHRVSLIWNRDGVGVMQAFSQDDGNSFETPTTLMANRYFGTTASNKHGWIVYAAFEYDSGTSGPGTIWLRLQAPDQNSSATAIQVVDGSAVAYKFEPDQFHVMWIGNSQDQMILTAKGEGASAPSEWVSANDGISWDPV